MGHIFFAICRGTTPKKWESVFWKHGRINTKLTKLTSTTSNIRNRATNQTRPYLSNFYFGVTSNYIYTWGGELTGGPSATISLVNFAYVILRRHLRLHSFLNETRTRQ